MVKVGIMDEDDYIDTYHVSPVEEGEEMQGVDIRRIMIHIRISPAHNTHTHTNTKPTHLAHSPVISFRESAANIPVYVQGVDLRGARLRV